MVEKRRTLGDTIIYNKTGLSILIQDRNLFIDMILIRQVCLYRQSTMQKKKYELLRKVLNMKF